MNDYAKPPRLPVNHPASPSQNFSLCFEEPREATYIIVCTIRPGCEDAFLQLLRPVLQAMRHEATFRHAVLHRDPVIAGRYMLYETWSDGDDVMSVQIHRPYREAFWQQLPALLDGERAVQQWVPIEGDFVF